MKRPCMSLPRLGFQRPAAAGPLLEGAGRRGAAPAALSCSQPSARPGTAPSAIPPGAVQPQHTGHSRHRGEPGEVPPGRGGEERHRTGEGQDGAGKLPLPAEQQPTSIRKWSPTRTNTQGGGSRRGSANQARCATKNAPGTAPGPLPRCGRPSGPRRPPTCPSPCLPTWHVPPTGAPVPSGAARPLHVTVMRPGQRWKHLDSLPVCERSGADAKLNSNQGPPPSPSRAASVLASPRCRQKRGPTPRFWPSVHWRLFPHLIAATRLAAAVAATINPSVPAGTRSCARLEKKVEVADAPAYLRALHGVTGGRGHGDRLGTGPAIP
jgi:hypothetical protein